MKNLKKWESSQKLTKGQLSTIKYLLRRFNSYVEKNERFMTVADIRVELLYGGVAMFDFGIKAKNPAHIMMLRDSWYYFLIGKKGAINSIRVSKHGSFKKYKKIYFGYQDYPVLTNKNLGA